MSASGKAPYHRSRFVNRLAAAVSLNIAFAVADGNASRIVCHDIESATIAGNRVGISNKRHIEVYLPDGYQVGQRRYPVVYWIPGYGDGGDRNNASVYKKALDVAIHDGRIAPTICVFIDVHEGIWFLNSLAVGNWEDFMVSELVPFIDKTYSITPDPRARALMGASAGGYSALILSVLHPDIWGCVGGNDPATWLMWYPLVDGSDVPVTNDFGPLRAGYGNMPEDIGGYGGKDLYAKALIQLGTSFSPNPNSPILCDLPVTPEGNWVPQVREKWSAYDLTNRNTLAKYVDILKTRLSIAVVVPEVMDVNVTNSYPNIYLLGLLRAAGITITRLDMPGGHSDFAQERFIALTEQLQKVVLGSGSGRTTEKEVPVKPPGEVKMDFVWIEPGRFGMGSPASESGREKDEGPQHEVKITKGFLLGRYEVTQAQWEAVMGSRPWSGHTGVQEDPNNPAVFISWDDVQLFIHKLNQAAGDSLYRLPTEAEWEYACRAGTTTAWSFGEDEGRLQDYSWYDANAYGLGEKNSAHRVGTKQPNPWGLHDMHGNVWEWCQDWYGGYLSKGQADPNGPTSGTDRVYRGGGFCYYARYTRSAVRYAINPDYRVSFLGARLLKNR